MISLGNLFSEGEINAQNKEKEPTITPGMDHELIREATKKRKKKTLKQPKSLPFHGMKSRTKKCRHLAAAFYIETIYRPIPVLWLALMLLVFMLIL